MRSFVEVELFGKKVAITLRELMAFKFITEVKQSHSLYLDSAALIASVARRLDVDFKAIADRAYTKTWQDQ